jgi:hypothetical protein
MAHESFIIFGGLYTINQASIPRPLPFMDPYNTKHDTNMPKEAGTHENTTEKKKVPEFALFVKANYGKVSKEHPLMSSKDVMHKIAIMWKEHSR